MPYQPLTEDQFNSAKSKGFNVDQIIEFEKQRKAQDRTQYEGGAESPANIAAQQDLKQAQFNNSPIMDAGRNINAVVQPAGRMANSALLGIPGITSELLSGGHMANPLTHGGRITEGGTNVFEGGGMSEGQKIAADIGGMAVPVGAAIKGVGSVLGKTVGAPFKETKVIQGQLDALKGEVDLPKEATTGYLNKKIIEREQQILADKKQQINNVKNYVNSKIDDIKVDKSEFDKKILNSKLTDFSKYMKESGVDWAKKGSKKYGEGIDKISSLIPEDAPITASDATNFLKDITMNAEAQGINSPMLSYIKQLSNKYEDLAVKGMDAGVDNIPVNFGTLKSEISGVNKYLSPGFKSGKYIEGGDRLASMTKGKWLDFMGKYIPEEGIAEYSKLQKNYKQFADAKRNIGNMFHPYSGEFDLKAGIDSGKKIALDNINEGTQNLMKIMDKGIPDFVPGMPGFAEKTQGLVKAGQEKKILDIFPGLIQKSGKLATDKIENAAAEQLKQTTAWRKKYEDLVELQKRNEEAKDKIMNIMSFGIKPVAKMAKKVVGF